MSGLLERTSDPIHDRVSGAIRLTQDHLFSIQKEDGHWCGELEGDTVLGSEYIIAMHFLGRSGEPKVRKAAEYIRRKQLPDGGWAIYPGGPPEVSSSTKAYFVLKLVGDKPQQPHMTRAREAIRRLGGIEACNSFTKIYLSIFGLYDWDRCPALPPEMVLLPRWFYINIYEMSSWSRAIFIPLSIIWAKRPHCPVPRHARIDELYVPGVTQKQRSWWGTLFVGIDRGLKLLEKLPVKPSREVAIKKAERWVLQRLRDSDGLGAIFPSIVNTIVALRSLGYHVKHPTLRQQVRELEKLEIEEEETLRVQPCFSPVWDTALSLNALIESGIPADHPDILRAARWVLDRRGNGEGDWRIKNPRIDRPGWFFEYANPYYPDNDTTAKVVTALSKVGFHAGPEKTRRDRALHEAHRWHLSMQNRDGGWAAFDKQCDKEFLSHIPFADHNAMLDPSNEDITARILETFTCLGHDASYPAARRAIRFLRHKQEADGSWYGRWGCNYLYGTWLALWGLRSIGQDVNADWGQRARRWILDCQNEDGGWGELPQSYDDARHKGRGPSTASQTAWALLGLMVFDDLPAEAIGRGVQYLLAEQREDGSWHEDYWTGTGFPCVFYLRYHLYGTYFPLLALSAYMSDVAEKSGWRRTA